MPSFKLLSKLLIMDPKTRITSAKAMEDEYFQDKVDGLPQGNHFEINICKVSSLWSSYPYYPKRTTVVCLKSGLACVRIFGKSPDFLEKSCF